MFVHINIVFDPHFMDDGSVKSPVRRVSYIGDRRTAVRLNPFSVDFTADANPSRAFCCFILSYQLAGEGRPSSRSARAPRTLFSNAHAAQYEPHAAAGYCINVSSPQYDNVSCIITSIFVFIEHHVSDWRTIHDE